MRHRLEDHPGQAFGRSLEAASLNPALLPTLEDRVSAYLAFGMELQEGQTSLQSNQRVLVGADRNRFLPAFGAGLTWCAHLVRWGERVTPLGTTDVELPPCDRTGLEIVNDLRARRAIYHQAAAPFIEAARHLLDEPAA